MRKRKINLQLFAEGGGDSAGAAPGTGALGGAGVTEGEKGKGESLANVVYGKQPEGVIAAPKGENTEPQKTKDQLFDDMIKGEYKDAFQKKTQGIIDRRFKETKSMQETLASHDAILGMLSEKYGVDATNVADLQKALENDESFYEAEAVEKGMTVQQLKEMRKLERENAELRKAREQREIAERSQQIYAQWQQQSEELKAKYGLDNFSFEEEIGNPDFVNLLKAGISVESAYKAIHMDDMIGGAMAKAASSVKEKMANNIASRQSRPSENGLSSNAQVFKTDVNALTRADRDEIERRALRGETISF